MSLKRKHTEQKEHGKPDYATRLANAKLPRRTEEETKDLVKIMQDRDEDITKFLSTLFDEAVAYFPAGEGDDNEDSEDLSDFLNNSSKEKMKTEWMNPAKLLLAQYIATWKLGLDDFMIPKDENYGLNIHMMNEDSSVIYMFTSLPWRTIVLLALLNTYEPWISMIKLIDTLRKKEECQMVRPNEELYSRHEFSGIATPLLIPKDKTKCTILLVIYDSR